MVGNLFEAFKDLPSRMDADQPLRRPALFHIAVGTGDLSSKNPKQLSEGASSAPKSHVFPKLTKKTMGLSITPLTPPTPATVPRPELGPRTVLTFSDLTTDSLKAPGILSPSPSPSSGPLAPSPSLSSGALAPSPSLSSGPLASGKNTRSSKRSPRKPVKLLENLPEKAAPKALPSAAKKKNEAVAKKEPKQRVQKAEDTSRPKKRQRGAAAALAAAAGLSENAIKKRAEVIKDNLPEKPRGVSVSNTQGRKYRAQIWKGGQVVYLGVFDSMRDACIRYDLETIRARHPKQWSLNFHIDNYPKEVNAAKEALQKKAKSLEEKQEAAKPNPKTKTQPKSKSVAKAASPLPLAPAPATTAKPARDRARKPPKEQGTSKAGPKQGSSQYKGVSWSDRSSKWRAQIWVKGAIRHIGFYKKEIDAASAYDLSSLEFHGPQAQTHNLGMQLTMKDLESFSYFSDPKTRACIASSRKKDGEATDGAMLLKYASDLYHGRFCLQELTPSSRRHSGAGSRWRSLMMRMKRSYCLAF